MEKRYFHCPHYVIELVLKQVQLFVILIYKSQSLTPRQRHILNDIKSIPFVVHIKIKPAQKDFILYLS